MMVRRVKMKYLAGRRQDVQLPGHCLVVHDRLREGPVDTDSEQYDQKGLGGNLVIFPRHCAEHCRRMLRRDSQVDATNAVRSDCIPPPQRASTLEPILIIST